MARKTLLASGKDFPDKPRGAPVFQRARQGPNMNSIGEISLLTHAIRNGVGALLALRQ